VIAAAPAVGRRVRVAGAGRSAAYGEDGGFVVVFTREPPVLPNGVQVGRVPAVGTGFVVRADDVWDPTLRLGAPGGIVTCDELVARDELVALDDLVGDELVAVDDLVARDELVAHDDLARAVESRDPSAAASAGARLIGRGPGLTPEGDDLVSGVVAVIAAADWPGAVKEAWVGALIGADLRRRTTALSATLLELATAGMGPEPLQAWLAGDGAARGRLEAIGHSTGRAIARGAAIALSRNRGVASRG